MEQTKQMYICSWLARSWSGVVTHGIGTCDASSHAEAYGIIKGNIAEQFPKHVIHIANIASLDSLSKRVFDVREFESQ